MRVLLVHNFYGSSAPSGENVAFELERGLLERAGHQVRAFVRHSDALRRRGWVGALLGAASTPWNPFARAALLREAAAFRPDVVHAHNTFPLISPAIFPPLGRLAARVLTLHNYRLLCPAGIPVRQGLPCTECLDQRSTWPALRHGCYRGSRAATLPLALSVALERARGTWQRHVDAFVALTGFQRDLLVAAGLPAAKIHVKPNFYPGRPAARDFAGREGAVYVGRLSEEKGVRHLLEAWRAWGPSAPPLRVVGDGPLRGALEAQAAGLPVRFLGQLAPADAEAEIAGARLLLLPSVCFEGFPMVIREAYALGTPVAVSDAGPLPSLVGDGREGVVFRAGDAASLHARVRDAWQAPGVLAACAAGARRAYEARYAEAENLRALLAIYQRAIEASPLAGRGPGGASTGRAA